MQNLGIYAPDKLSTNPISPIKNHAVVTTTRITTAFKGVLKSLNSTLSILSPLVCVVFKCC